ncbi:MAG: hypothetical protein DDT34_01943 [Firmicutes bacterium]|nr:hypothetical protein [Bacillota bacterium]
MMEIFLDRFVHDGIESVRFFKSNDAVLDIPNLIVKSSLARRRTNVSFKYSGLVTLGVSALLRVIQYASIHQDLVYAGRIQK